mgnify:CR=1 FL=1
MSESDLQMNVVNYIKMQYPKAKYCASLGGIRTSTEARHNYHGLFIELKTTKGRPTTYQKDWIEALSERGYRAVICKGFDECKKEIDWYLKKPHKQTLTGFYI